MDQAELLMTRAHALRRLNEQFSGGVLSPSDAQIISKLRRDHMQAMAGETARLQRLLSPVFRGLGAVSGKPAGETSAFAAARGLETALAELTGARPLSGNRDGLPSRVASQLLALTQILADRP